MTLRINILPEFHLSSNTSNEHFPLSRTLKLLRAIENLHNMKEASQSVGLSYRHAWNLIEQAQSLFGGAILESVPGRGSGLTELGKKLVWAEKLTEARLGPLLESISSEISEDIEALTRRTRRVLRLFASHGFAVALLNEFLNQRGIELDFNYRGSKESLDAFSRQICDIAGFHVPLGELEKPYLDLIKVPLPDDVRYIELARRNQGLIVAKNNPKSIHQIEDLARPEVLFVNRQPSSGTRLTLDMLLRKHRLSTNSIKGYGNTEYTHAAVGAYIASGKADVGLGVETAAKQFDLDFIPLYTERYFYLCNESLLSDNRFTPILALLYDRDFLEAMGHLTGYSAEHTGRITGPNDTFTDSHD
ncbi:MAG: helix-turn-helix transcriptional regulator [Betaproteobacteria bacterium]|nr:LysR family transcriptional regulator [Betaproteobacteria bacterium]MDE2422737.1 helix-turn-helix transcriptional regulator [Betaproteobacteria bacterium]